MPLFLWAAYLSIVNLQARPLRLTVAKSVLVILSEPGASEAAFTFNYGWEWLTCEAIPTGPTDFL